MLALSPVILVMLGLTSLVGRRLRPVGAGMVLELSRAGSLFLGTRLHMKMDLDHGLIRELEASAANVHDSRVDLSRLGEVVYRG